VEVKGKHRKGKHRKGKQEVVVANAIKYRVA
jgi:hypothetical protein